MKNTFLLMIAFAISGLCFYSYFSFSRNKIIEHEILNFKTKNINVEKIKTDFLDANYIECATTSDNPQSNDTIWKGTIDYDFSKIQRKWNKLFPKTSLDTVKSSERVGVNMMNNLDRKNLYKIIIDMKTLKSKPFAAGFEIKQTITHKNKDTLKILSAGKEYWWNFYKWELTKNFEVQNSYYKMY